MKLSLSVTPKFVHAPRFCRLFAISGITLLWWVLHVSPIERHSDEFKMEETIHSNQQTFLFLLGLLACAVTSLILGAAGMVTPWWVWTFPATVPLLLYVLIWIVEIALPPYDRAYYDSPFEREAKINRSNPNYKPTFFSVWRYFRHDRPFIEKKSEGGK